MPLKSKTHQASVSGGAGFGSLQDFVFLSSLVPSTPERVVKLLPPRLRHEFGVNRGFSSQVHRWYRSQGAAARGKSEAWTASGPEALERKDREEKPAEPLIESSVYSAISAAFLSALSDERLFKVL
jgi:hypothetical protein